MPPVYTTGISQNPAQAYVDLPQVTRDYLATGESPGNRDNALFAAACQFRDAGYSQQEAAAALIPRAEADGFSEAYAIKKLESAYSRSARQPCRSRGSNHSGAACSSTAAPRVEQTSETVRSEQVRLDPKGSKARPLPNPIAEGCRVMLETCFLPGEGVSIGDGTRNSEGELVLSAGQVLPLEHWLKRLRSKSIMDIYPAREGVFVRINPVWLPRGKTDADVTAFRYLLIDFDEDANGQPVPKEVQYGWLVDSNLPIDSIVDTANRGLHALVRVDAPNRKEFERRRDLVFEYFALCPGFDTKNRNPSRYSRLPGAIRNLYDDNSQLIGTAAQELLAIKVGATSWEKWEMAQPYQRKVFPSLKERPCYRVYDLPFKEKGRDWEPGVYLHTVELKDDGSGNKTKVAAELWVTSVLRVLCIVRTDSDNGHAYLLEYIPHGGAQPRRAVLSQALLLGRGEEAMKELRDLGVSVLGSKAKCVREYLDLEHLRFSSRKTPDDFWTSVKVIGWAPVGQRFVLPHETIGLQTGVWFSGKTDVAQYKKNGDFNLWKSKVAALCEGNPYLILALSCAFAGPLLEPLNIPGLGIHYFGDSTTGKSTSLAVAASAWGSEKFMISWRTTINGLEGQAAQRCSTLIPVDESHQVDPKALDASVYMLLNGTSKARMNKDTSPREIEHWRACVISSGERSIETHQANANIDHKVGQTVRIVDVPVVTGQYGLFEDIHEAKNGAEFSDALRDAAAKHYGHAGPIFIEKLIQNYSGLGLPDRLASLLQEFGNDLSAQDRRVARSFAVAALAGELAIEWEILPWPTRSALIATVEIFKQWKKTQPQSSKSKEDARVLKNLSDFFGAYGDTRCTDIKLRTYVDYTDPKNPVVKKCQEQPLQKGVNRAGYWDDSTGNRIYLLYPAALVEAGKFELPRILAALEAASAFAATGTGTEKAKRRRTPDGRNPKLYWIDPEKLELNP